MMLRRQRNKCCAWSATTAQQQRNKKRNLDSDSEYISGPDRTRGRASRADAGPGRTGGEQGEGKPGDGKPEPTAVAIAEERRLIASIPELDAAHSDAVDPLPANSLRHGGIFAKLKLEHLKRPASLVEWFRRQLSSPKPALPGTRAHLLLVLAAARHALAIPERDVRKSRVAAFVRIVSRRAWLQCSHYLDQALADLESAADLLVADDTTRAAK